VLARPIVIHYAPRRQFLPFHHRKQRWAILVCHRRAGKTVATINDVIKRAVIENKPDGRYAFIAPYYNQVKDIAWTYLKSYAEPILAEPPREAELSVLLVNGARIRLYGSDNPDRLRGIYLDGAVLDEFGDMIPALWTDVIRPALSDRKGWATFIGTPKGKNAFWELWAGDQKGWPGAINLSQEWFSLMLKASATGLVPAAELADARKQMGDAQYQQEYECSFEAAIKGAFYGDEMQLMAAEGRIRRIDIDPLIRVHTGWDIGRTDSTVIWFIQCVGRERRLVDYHEDSGHIITHYADVLYDKKREHGWQYGEHFFPHDMAYKMIDAEKSRLGQMQAKGIDGQICPQHAVLEGVNVVRKMLGRTYIDPTRCGRGIEALRQYRRAWDEKLKDWKSNEHEDWTNHGADALRTFAVMFDDPAPITPDADRHRKQAPASATSWAA
jgi:phage terminase large subunit